MLVKYQFNNYKTKNQFLVKYINQFQKLKKLKVTMSNTTKMNLINYRVQKVHKMVKNKSILQKSKSNQMVQVHKSQMLRHNQDRDNLDK